MIGRSAIDRGFRTATFAPALELVDWPANELANTKVGVRTNQSNSAEPCAAGKGTMA